MFGRRIGAGVLGVVVVATFGLTGCKPDNTPKAYNTLTQQNFVELCTNHYYTSSGTITDTESGATASTLDPALTSTNSTIAANVDASDQSSCLCMYSAFVAAMSIGDFTTLNKNLKSDPTSAWNNVPQGIKDAVTACGSGSSGGSTTTTTAASTTTTN